MRGDYFVDFMGSFALGNPDIVEDWKAVAKAAEAEHKQVAIFILPENEISNTVVSIEKLLRDKLGTPKALKP
jgi:hypothetical protein